ncbi:MAG: pyridoxamine 5'-phosphate oxidase family protein [Thermoanaerobaculia bacterium]|nr:pyridoxamine 5'-phosphate oxidase family protein [Thermoanaerobaculia bacterium]
MTHDEIERFLATEVVARLGCHADGRTYVVPVAYAHAGNAIYSFSHDGLKLAMIRENPRVCVEIDRVEHLGSWRSVIAQGHAEILEGNAAAEASSLLASRLASLVSDPVSRARLEEALTSDAPPFVLRIELTDTTGRVEGTVRP